MAAVWLNQNISVWNTPAAFDYWDENTQSIQPYGQTPQNGDTFYLNGYSYTGTESITAPGVKISNSANSYTERSGGIMQIRSVSLSCKEIEVGNTTFATSGAINNTTSPTFSANINLIGTGALYNKGGNGGCTITINGNVFRNSLNVIVTGVTGSTLRVNGNYEAEANVGTNVTSNITINGNCTLHNASLNGNTAVSTINISGDIIIINTRLVGTTSGTTTLGGHNLYYDGTIEPIRGFIINGVVINSDDFSFHNLNNEYKTYLLSKYQLDNTSQYPDESNVKKDITYAYGAKTGTLVPVNNTNTINIYRRR